MYWEIHHCPNLVGSAAPTVTSSTAKSYAQDAVLPETVVTPKPTANPFMCTYCVSDYSGGILLHQPGCPTLLSKPIHTEPYDIHHTHDFHPATSGSMPSPTLNGHTDNRTPTEQIEQQLKTQPGTKYDGEKPRVDLLPVYPLLEEAKVLTYGAAKYNARNWEKGFDWSRAYGALLRHLFAFWQGEDIDPESGLHHLAHAKCELDFLFEFTRTHPEFDDRPKEA